MVRNKSKYKKCGLFFPRIICLSDMINPLINRIIILQNNCYLLSMIFDIRTEFFKYLFENFKINLLCLFIHGFIIPDKQSVLGNKSFLNLILTYWFMSKAILLNSGTPCIFLREFVILLPV